PQNAAGHGTRRSRLDSGFRACCELPLRASQHPLPVADPRQPAARRSSLDGLGRTSEQFLRVGVAERDDSSVQDVCGHGSLVAVQTWLETYAWREPCIGTLINQ